MAKRFSELRAAMTLEARALADRQTHVELQLEASKGAREDFDRFLTAVPKGQPIAGDVIVATGG